MRPLNLKYLLNNQIINEHRSKILVIKIIIKIVKIIRFVNVSVFLVSISFFLNKLFLKGYFDLKLLLLEFLNFVVHKLLHARYLIYYLKSLIVLLKYF